MNEELIHKAIGGDGQAFAEVFTEVQEELYRVAYLYVKNREDACDVVQETAYRCFKGIKKLKSNQYFRTWAVRTAINCSLDILRKRHETVQIEDMTWLEDEKTSPEGSAVAKETLGWLMNLLDEREKSVVIMKYLYDMSFSEISKSMKLPLGTVKTILYRAMSKIKKEDFL